MEVWDFVGPYREEIERQQGEISRAQSSVRSERVAKLVQKYDEHLSRLVLICRGMWSLLAERTSLTEQDLNRRITQIDLQDGRLDGKVRKKPIKCPTCRAMICRSFNRCLFCGFEFTGGDPFDTV